MSSLPKPPKRGKRVVQRTPLKKGLRFEILRRDGFKCRYCGATPNQGVLHVDHIVPVAEGGANEHSNLVTACSTCNLGKNSKSLGASVVSLKDPATMKEQAEQILAYVEAQKSLHDAEESICAVMQELWEDQIGPMSVQMWNRMHSVIRKHPHDRIVAAIRGTGVSRLASPGADFVWSKALSQQKYFSAILRNLAAADRVAAEGGRGESVPAAARGGSNQAEKPTSYQGFSSAHRRSSVDPPSTVPDRRGDIDEIVKALAKEMRP